MPADVTALTLEVAERMALTRGRTIHGLLRNLAGMVRQRRTEAVEGRSAETNFISVLHALHDDKMEPWDIPPPPPLSCPTPCPSPEGGGRASLGQHKIFVTAHCFVVWVTVL